MVNNKTLILSRAACILFLTGLLCSGMAPRPAPPPVPIQFIRAETDPEAGAIAIEWVVPRIEAVGPISRLELLILDPEMNAIFGALQNLSDRCDPVPPGAFGVVLDPASEDRSIKNVASAGINGQWDQDSKGGTLLEKSVSGVVADNLGIAFWIAPKGWGPGRHLILARAVRKKCAPEPWRNLATLDLADDGMTVISSWGIVKPVFQVVGERDSMKLEDLGSFTLVRYERREQPAGVEVRRWEGDAAGQYQYVEMDRRELTSADLPEGLLSLQPGCYQIKHLSASGEPPTGFYGESPVFEIKPDPEPVEIQVLLYPAI